MKRLLYAAIQLPWPLDVGQKIVTFNDLQYLSRSFTIDVVSYIDASSVDRRDEYLATLRERLPGVRFLDPVIHTILHGHPIRDKVLPLVLGLSRGEPYMVGKYHSQAYIRTLRQQLAGQRYDAICIDHLSPSYLLRSIPAAALQNLLVIYRAHDIFSETLESYARELGLSPVRLAVGLDKLICERYERWLWERADVILPVTRRMEQLIIAAAAGLSEKTTYFPVAYPLPPAIPAGRERALRVLYVGTVHYPPNFAGLRWFLDECWPQVVARIPGATLDIVGRGGENLAPVPDSVRFHSYVDDLTPFYNAADCFVVPLFSGSGVRLKILDTLSRGLAVVSTTPGYAGLEVVPGEDLLVADDAHGFTDHICRVLQEPELQDRLGSAGRHFVTRFHSPALTEAAIKALLSRIDTGSLAGLPR